MLKKLLTGCLTIVAAAALAAPTMAVDMSGKIGGRAVADLYSYSAKIVNTNTGKAGDTVSYMDMASEGRLDYTLTAKDGDWTASGKFEVRSSVGTNAYSDIVVLQKYIKLENDAFAVSLGTQWWGFVYLTPYTGNSGVWDRFCYGCIDLRADRLIVAVKNVGLQVEYKVNNEDTADSTTDAYDETQYGLQYTGAFGPVNVAAAYVSQSWKANKNQDAATEKTAKDGRVITQLAAAAQYVLNGAMFIEGDYEATSSTDGTSGAKTQTKNTMGLSFAMAMSPVQGFMVAYDQTTENTGVSGAKDVVTTLLTASFEQKIAGQKFWVGYNSSSKDFGVSGADTETKSTISLGGRVSF